ncbi:hypothetical protein GCM10009332_23930 [Shewanella gelidii]|uniref:Uncharacterized protein n=1 Tax=Shewanella gelidii TaxID=1642821 RepID=A0A917JUN3_9GAMM|nr:hypothetical protein GCM10009332_23930 [Shewanella gelidii]
MVGLGIYKAQCALFSGFHLSEPIYAGNKGYLLSDSRNWGSKHGYNGYVSRAFEDLVTGRIGFFEVYRYGSNQVNKYFLTDKKSISCAPIRIVRMLIGSIDKIPKSKCLGMEALESPSSRYLVTGYNKRGAGRNPSVTDTKTGDVVSKLRWFSLSTKPYILFSKGGNQSCPSSAHYPKQLITAFTFKDKFGFIWPWKDDIELPKEIKNRNGTFSPKKNKNDYDVSEVIEKPCSNFMKRINDTGISYSFHKIKAYRGNKEVSINLDRQRSKSSEIDVFVNKTDKPIMLYLTGYDPIIWNIYQEEGAKILGIFAGGNHGKAIIGPDNSTRVLIHTSEYNPGVNCSSFDFFTSFSKETNMRRDFDSVNDVKVGNRFVIGGQYKRADDYKTYNDYPIENYLFLKKHNK